MAPDEQDDRALRELRAEISLREVLATPDGPRATVETLQRAEALVAEFDGDDSPVIRLAVARARVKRADLLARLDEDEDALAAFAAAAAAYDADPDAALREVGADAHHYRAKLLRALGRTGEAFAELRALVAAHEHSDHPGTRHTHALAQLDLARWLAATGDDADGPTHLQRVVDAWAAVVASHGASDAAPEAWATVTAVREQAKALRRLADVVADLPEDEPQEASASELLARADLVADQAFRRYADHPDDEVRDQAYALRLDCLDAWDEPARVLRGADELVALAEHETLATFDGQLAKALRLRAWALGDLGRGDEALATLDRLSARFAASEDPWVVDSMLRGTITRARLLRDAGRGAEAVGPLLATQAALDLGHAGLRAPVARALRLAAEILAEQAPPPREDTPDGVDGISVDDDGYDLGMADELSPAEVAYAEAVDALVRRFADDASTEVRRTVAQALYDLGLHQRERLHLEAARATYARLVGLFAADADPQVEAAVAKGWLNAGFIEFVLLGRPEEALATYDALLARYDTTVHPQVRQVVARAATTRATCINRLTRAGASVSHGEGVEQLTAADLDALFALVEEADAFADHNEYHRALEAYGRVLDGRLDSLHPEVRRRCVHALVQQARCLRHLSRDEEAVAVAREAIDRYGHDLSLDVQKDVALGLAVLALALDALDRHDEEVAAYDETIRRWSTSDIPTLQWRVGNALGDKGVTLADLGRAGEAELAYALGADRFLEATDPQLRHNGLRCGVGLGMMLRKAGRAEEACAAYRRVLAVAGLADSQEREQAARAHLGLARALTATGARLEAVAEYEAALAMSDLPEALRRHATEELESVRPADGLKGLVRGFRKWLREP